MLVIDSGRALQRVARQPYNAVSAAARWSTISQSTTYLNTFAFLATSLCRCATAGAMMGLYYQPVERRWKESKVWGSSGS